ncbi:MAG: hypothetical protein ABI443_09825 [Chthoniobacterales bacterium]
MRFLSLILLLATTGMLHAETIREHLKKDPNFELYAVIFAVIQNDDASIKDVRTANIFDAASDSKESLNIALPKSYFEKAAKAIADHKYPLQKKDGKPAMFFVYYFYSPQLGDRLIDDADADMAKKE